MLLLIIEDDISIQRVLKDNLEIEGYEVLSATDGDSGLKLATEKPVDLVLLDLMLPGLNGYEVCRRIKKTTPETLIMMTTAKGSEMEKIAGLDMGADDYLAKPFSIPELLARVRALLRRVKKAEMETDSFSFGEVTIDFKKMQATRSSQPLSFSLKEFEILKYLITHDGAVVPRNVLLEEVWGYDAVPSTRTVDNFIMEIRKKIEINPSDPRFIVGVRGIGYRFNSKGEE